MIEREATAVAAEISRSVEKGNPLIDYLRQSHKYFSAFLCLMFFAVCLLMFSIQTIAKTSSCLPGQRERRLQIFFTYSPSRPAAGQEVHFKDFSRGNPTSWQWDFGDGGASTSQNPSHVYVTTGSYWVSLTIKKGTSSHSMSRMITVREAGIIRAASPSYMDVSAAVSAANPGDTVIVPAGSATWTDHLVITKGINLIGAGIDQTVFTSNYNGSAIYEPSGYLISYHPSNPSANEPCRISGFTINCASRCFGIYLYNRTLNVINKIRVDHTKIINPYGARPFGLSGAIYGVADNNEWHGVYITFLGADATETWKNLTFDFGTADNFYLEDNLFVGSGQNLGISSAAGARWCSRYNTYDGSACTGGLYPHHDAHGNQPTSNPAVMGVELYENTTIMPSSYNVILFGQRGGKALVFNNKVYANQASAHVREEFNDADNPPASSPISGQPQHVSDSYWWNNILNDTTLITVEINQTYNYGGDEGLVPRENREFWQQKNPFDGTVGMGVGPRSVRPATCIQGVGYWATDERRLYRATATNTWTLYYTPYTYPHPLRALLSTPVADGKKKVDQRQLSFLGYIIININYPHLF